MRNSSLLVLLLHGIHCVWPLQEAPPPKRKNAQDNVFLVEAFLEGFF
jgi:hypothetical protein